MWKIFHTKKIPRAIFTARAHTKTCVFTHAHTKTRRFCAFCKNAIPAHTQKHALFAHYSPPRGPPKKCIIRIATQKWVAPKSAPHFFPWGGSQHPPCRRPHENAIYRPPMKVCGAHFVTGAFFIFFYAKKNICAWFFFIKKKKKKKKKKKIIFFLFFIFLFSFLK